MKKALIALLGLLLAASSAHARHARGGASASGGGATLVFNCSSFGGAGCDNTAIATPWNAVITGGRVYINQTSRGMHQASPAWYIAPQNITAFTTDFEFQSTVGGFGWTFCIQNSNATTNPTVYGLMASADANGLGYFAYASQTGIAIGNSVAIEFNASDRNQSTPAMYVGTPTSAIGLFLDGGPHVDNGSVPEQSTQAVGIDLTSGDTFAGHVVYDGTTLTLTLTDTVTAASANFSWVVDIPVIVGGSTAYVGFTAGTVTAADQDLVSWDWYSGYNTRLASPTFSVAQGQYSSAQTVTISGPAGATIHYTTDGTAPTPSSPTYSGALTVSVSEYVQAIAVESAFTDSLPAGANYQIGTGTAPVDFSTGFASASGLIKPVESAYISGANLVLTDVTTGHDRPSGSAFYVAPLNISAFTSSFTIQDTSVGSGPGGMTFAIFNQLPPSKSPAFNSISPVNNSVGGPYLVGYDGFTSNSMGTTPILESVAVKFDYSNNTTGVFLDGASPTTPQTTMTGINLASGDKMDVVLTYSGTTLGFSITDETTSTNFSTSFTVDIPATVGANTATVGFTGAAGYVSQSAIQEVTAWTYHN